MSLVLYVWSNSKAISLFVRWVRPVPTPILRPLPTELVTSWLSDHTLHNYTSLSLTHQTILRDPTLPPLVSEGCSPVPTPPGHSLCTWSLWGACCPQTPWSPPPLTPSRCLSSSPRDLFYCLHPVLYNKQHCETWQKKCKCSEVLQKKHNTVKYCRS